MAQHGKKEKTMLKPWVRRADDLPGAGWNLHLLGMVSRGRGYCRQPHLNSTSSHGKSLGLVVGVGVGPDFGG